MVGRKQNNQIKDLYLNDLEQLVLLKEINVFGEFTFSMCSDNMNKIKKVFDACSAKSLAMRLSDFYFP